MRINIWCATYNSDYISSIQLTWNCTVTIYWTEWEDIWSMTFMDEVDAQDQLDTFIEILEKKMK